MGLAGFVWVNIRLRNVEGAGRDDVDAGFHANFTISVGPGRKPQRKLCECARKCAREKGWHGGCFAGRERRVAVFERAQNAF